MSSKLKVLQVIPKLGYGGAETGCYDLAHYLYEQKCQSYIVTSGGELLKYVNKKKVKIIRLPVHSKNPILIFINALILTFIILFYSVRNLFKHKKLAKIATLCGVLSGFSYIGVALTPSNIFLDQAA